MKYAIFQISLQILFLTLFTIVKTGNLFAEPEIGSTSDLQTITTVQKTDEKQVVSKTKNETVTKNKIEQKTDFLFRFLQSVRQNKEIGQNTMVSPYGVSSVAEMLTLGAAGETQKILQKTFVPDSVTETESEQARTTWYHLPEQKVSEPSVLPMTSADGMWIQKDFPIRPTYGETLKSLFCLNVSEADFAKQPDLECKKINAWIAQKTQNKITKLFETIEADTKIVLVNTLDFQGKWAVPFDKRQTKLLPFHCTKEKSIDVPMMSKTLRLAYSKQKTYQILSLPFEKNLCSLVILLPNEDQTLESIEDSLQEDQFSQQLDELVLEQVQCEIPQFQMETEIDLKPILTSLGAGIIFDTEKADFSGISEKTGLCVGKFIQKMIVKVEESGVQAASATGATVVPKNIPSTEPVQPILFRADRPFLFVIRDNKNGVPLFAGHFNGQ